MATWYKFLLAAWCLTVIPVIVVGYGFRGDHFVFPDVSVFGFWETVDFVVSLIWALSPLLLAPFGLRSRSRIPPA